MSKNKGTNWKLIGGVVLSLAVAGVAAYVISKKMKERKDDKKSRQKKASKRK